jgi:ABC-type nitrate/sulfonate/bicarbonate transport system permease component
MREAAVRVSLYALGFASMFVLWHLAAVYFVKSILFPPPWAVLIKAIELAGDGTLAANIGISLQRILLGFFCGSLIGIPLGLAIGSFVVVRRVLEPYTELFRFIPSTAMITVAVIWFGIGETSKVFLIAYTTVFVVIINTAAGVGSIAANKVRAARSLGASRAQIFFFVALPATVPFILTGMRMAMANSFTSIIAAELVAANAGLGTMIWNARLYMLVDDIFVALFVLGISGFIIDRAFRFAIFTFAGRFSPVI